MRPIVWNRIRVPSRNRLAKGGLFLLSLLLTSCSVEKNTSLSRNYHNLTSHYNIYFNGNESYKKGLEKAWGATKNDYTQILPLFLYEDEAVNAAVNADMKRAIDKATKVITFHSITAKPKVKEGEQSDSDKAFYEKKEFTKWVDDSYMLMGKAYMYQGEYFLAIETFKHVMVTFPGEEIRFLAMTWLARAYIMVDELREAERILVSLSGEEALPEEYLEVYLSTHAQYDIRKDSHASAAEYLENALIQKGLKKEEKIRYTYILAQLYEETGQKNLALERYKRVTRYNPPYEMAFNARVSMAGVFESGSSSSDELKTLLTKMLRDSKNKEYLDQIYFALGSIAFEEGEREKAIEYYQMSVSSSLQNRYQKGYSSLTLARIYYEEPDYILSAAYYDSAVSFLDKDYPGYKGLATLSASLTSLVYNINSYELEDSLQMLALLPEEERLSIIDGIIEEVRIAEETARQAEQQAMQDMAYNQSMMYNNPQAGGNTQQQGGQWYFYNLNAKSFGQPEFRMKWGDRKLEDNWRRKNKQSLSSLSPGESTEGDSLNGSAVTPLLDNKSREYYLANIPLSDSAVELSHARLEEALYNMGLIYKNDLLDDKAAIASFEELLERYSETEDAPAVLYYLYELYNNIQEKAKADQIYKAELISRFPESHYAKLLSNPNYIQELEAEERKVERTYEGIFGSYQRKDYRSVIAGVDSAVVRYPDDPLVPKFKYIKALSLGALMGKEAMKVELDSLIAQHPGTDESTEAQEVISYMYMSFPVIREAEEARVAEVTYSGFDPSQEHYFLLVLEKGENVNQVSFDLLNYNLDYFNPYDLEIERLDLTDGYSLLVVKSFTNSGSASRYLEVISSNSSLILAGIPVERYRMMVISIDNFSTLASQKVQNPYYLFYLKHYLNQEP